MNSTNFMSRPSVLNQQARRRADLFIGFMAAVLINLFAVLLVVIR